MAAAAAAALNPNSVYHAAAAAGFPNEGGMAARRMSRARPSVARQSKMRAKSDSDSSTAFSFRLPSRARNSSHVHGVSGGKNTARFGAYPKILLEDDEDEDGDESVYAGTEEGVSRFQNHPVRPGQHSSTASTGWAEKTAASMDRVEKRMAAVDGRLAERSEQLLGLRRSLDLLSAALPPLDNPHGPLYAPLPPTNHRNTGNNKDLHNFHARQDLARAEPLQEMGDAAERLLAMFDAEGQDNIQENHKQLPPKTHARALASRSAEAGASKQQSRSVALHRLSQLGVDSPGPVSTPSAWFNRPYSSNGGPAARSVADHL
mmetsp:Transcript_27234/g.56592  ORF Transcript_27234/g.56592 Transcript_27234/m.56592 type:complete len:318 (+) Transcript_27234:2254-3207(+)